jgi:hypothetical protein
MGRIRALGKIRGTIDPRIFPKAGIFPNPRATAHIVAHSGNITLISTKGLDGRDWGGECGESGAWNCADGCGRALGGCANAAFTRLGERGIHATRLNSGLVLAAGELLAEGG